MPKQLRSSAPSFHNVEVNVKPTPHGDGNTLGGKFHVICSPGPVTVESEYAVINYQLTGDTPSGIVFDGFDRARPNPRRQLSAPTISLDGKMMTFSDCNTDSEPLLIVLRFRDNTVTLFDPEVTNGPQPSR